MNRQIFALSAITALGLALVPSSIIAQQGTLKQQLVGTWTLASCDAILGNAKPPYIALIRPAFLCSTPVGDTLC
jgi:hypothetical protein